MKNLLILISVLLFVSCNKEKYFDGIDAYSDDFEHYTHVDSLIDGESLNWGFFQLTRDENYMILDTTFSHSGNQCIQFNATPSNKELGASKCSINKQKFAFWEGEVVSLSVWYYLEGTQKADWLFLMDLEENTAVGAGPGMRLALVDNRLRVEHKYLNPDIIQEKGNEIDFPRNQWVNVKFEALLSQKEKGWVKVYQDDQLILEQYDWQTQPTDILYSVQGTKGIYSNIEFGITANTHDNPTKLYVDDVEVKIIE